MTAVADHSVQRVRRCEACRLNVFNIAELSEAEVRALFTHKGRVCGRLLRRADGTVLTKDCPKGVAALRRRALSALVVAASVVLAVLGYGLQRTRAGCSTTSGTWFDRVVTSRVYAAREALRVSPALGPLINELFPLPAASVRGELELPLPSPLSPSSGS